MRYPPEEQLNIVRPDGNRGDDLGLRDIARRLTTPALSGMVLTRESIGQLCASLGLPAGYAERGRMLASALQAAAELGRLSELLSALLVEADRWDALYASWMSDYPASEPVWADWRGRLVATRSLLIEMLAAASGR